MSAGLAILREVERKYGKVATVFFHRDAEVLSGYKPFFTVKFDASVPHDSISMEGEVFKARVPRTQTFREGGVGLDDLQGILYYDADADVQEADAPTKPAGVEGVDWDLEDIKIAQSPYHSVRPSKQLSLRPEQYLQFADKWTAWGGFSTPLSSSAAHDGSAASMEEVPLAVRSPDLDLANAKYRSISEMDGRKISEPLPVAAQEPAPEFEPEQTEEVIEKEFSADAELAPLEWKPLRFDRQDRPSTTEVDASSAEETEAEAPESTKQAEKPLAQMSRRERVLHQARVNARTLPTVDEEAQRAEEARKAEEETKAKAESIRQRLWKLMGGRAP
ncbi:hypothetical protein EWM64_g3911 [Hericium alpestre]|uniref:Uncharacterized protein n=1 Tax=Hericium alpestre TaxID=135208 RepID=A0A4Z0A0X9_9AGAM|nr:hypothetical protein EWM64_g3911 [Hericium alpestre]